MALMIVGQNEGPGFEHLRREEFMFSVHVEFGRDEWGATVKVLRRAPGVLQCVTAQCRRFRYIETPPYYMSADDAGQYFALLDFIATAGQYRKVFLHDHRTGTSWNAQPPGMRTAMEDIVTAMIPVAEAQLHIIGVSLTLPMLHLALQCPHVLLCRCGMASRPLPPQPAALLVLPRNDATADRDDNPERGGTTLQITTCAYWREILQAATTIKSNNVINHLHLDFDRLKLGGGRLDISTLIKWITAQPNGIYLTLDRMRGGVDMVEGILADVATQCPLGAVHSMVIRVDPAVSPRIRDQHFPLLLQLVSDSVWTRFEVREIRVLDTRVLSQEQERQIAVLIERNRAIPVYLKTAHLLKPRRPLVVDPIIDPPIVVVYDNDNAGADDRTKHQYVLSHALSQAAVHPIFFSHFYQYIRDHADPLFGQEGRRCRPAPTAAEAPPRPPP
jgi:hypothetical protein